MSDLDHISLRRAITEAALSLSENAIAPLLVADAQFACGALGEGGRRERDWQREGGGTLQQATAREGVR